ncbi:Fungal specific transcription factor domain-containing protein [Pleurostoma richardsiae]|uniref:Fungal specific transcription factor domain-containing protein n=1 Tax=Pleurostoma richardsiae TaxID=41990 RepID=A0AA38RBV6_9PEZI|nr:Fungal specific transcription factor domain-containing protein [Pleurostoma richardsiae]
MPRPNTASGSSQSPAGGPSQRLPVNPRRHKVAPEQRKRVATACNSCNIRRIKCSGDRPCQQCQTGSRECVYPVAVEKVAIPRSELEDLRARCNALEKSLRDAVPDPAARQQLLARQSSISSSHESAGDSPTPSASAPGPRGPSPMDEDHHPPPPMAGEGLLLQDFDGNSRWMGGTSGATFLDHLKQFMSTIFPLTFDQRASQPQHPDAAHSSGSGSGSASAAGPSSSISGATFLSTVGRYQTFDSRPMFVPRLVDPLVLPPPTEMSFMASQVRWFIQDGAGDAAGGGIYYWGDMTTPPTAPILSSPPPLIPPSSAGGAVPDPALKAHRHLAFHHSVFAFASLLGLTAPGSRRDGQLGEGYLARARALLGNPLDTSLFGKGDVPALALLARYMLEVNRRDAAYVYVAVAMHICVVHGVHRGWQVDERGKRVFWTLYVLDRWVSCLMGRPPTILDDAIRLNLPADAPGLPSPEGLTANVLLSRIAGHIVCNTYRIAPWIHGVVEKPSAQINRALELLSGWHSRLPPSLQMSYETFSNDRGLCTLHMAYNQLLILTVRPIFFLAVKKAVADRFVSRRQRQPPQFDIEAHPLVDAIRSCSDAARLNLRLGRRVRDDAGGPAGKLLLPDLHNVFNAAVVLMLHQAVFVNLRTMDTHDIAFAIEVFEREAATGDDYAADCARILADLSALVGRLRGFMFDNSSSAGIPPELRVAGAAGVGSGGGGAGAGAGGVGLGIAADSLAGGIPMGFGPAPPMGSAEAGSGPFPPGAGAGNTIYQELVTWLAPDDMQGYENIL